MGIQFERTSSRTLHGKSNLSISICCNINKFRQREYLIKDICRKVSDTVDIPISLPNKLPIVKRIRDVCDESKKFNKLLKLYCL